MARLNKLDQIKAQQLKETPEIYGVDMASGADETGIRVVMVEGNNGTFEQLQVAMEVHRGRIKESKTLEEKARVKAELVPDYLPFVDAYLINGDDYPCDVAVWVMIWLFDIGSIEKGLELGLYLIKTGNQKMPRGFSSDFETFICDQMYDWSNVQLKADQSASPYLDEVVSTMQVDGWDLHPLVAGKVFNMAAKHKSRIGDDEGCIALCELAEKANPKKAGVKTMMTDALKRIQSAFKEKD